MGMTSGPGGKQFAHRLSLVWIEGLAEFSGYGVDEAQGKVIVEHGVWCPISRSLSWRERYPDVRGNLKVEWEGRLVEGSGCGSGRGGGARGGTRGRHGDVVGGRGRGISSCEEGEGREQEQGFDVARGRGAGGGTNIGGPKKEQAGSSAEGGYSGVDGVGKTQSAPSVVMSSMEFSPSAFATGLEDENFLLSPRLKILSTKSLYTFGRAGQQSDEEFAHEEFADAHSGDEGTARDAGALAGAVLSDPPPQKSNMSDEPVHHPNIPSQQEDNLCQTHSRNPVRKICQPKPLRHDPSSADHDYRLADHDDRLSSWSAEEGSCYAADHVVRSPSTPSDRRSNRCGNNSTSTTSDSDAPPPNMNDLPEACMNPEELAFFQQRESCCIVGFFEGNDGRGGRFEIRMRRNQGRRSNWEEPAHGHGRRRSYADCIFLPSPKIPRKFFANTQ